MASTYDSTFGATVAGRLFRFRLAERIASSVTPTARILDLGSGTGEDAIWLSRLGYRVHGIDESKAMVEIAREKAGRARVSATFECGSFLDVPPGGDSYDVVMSNFGVLNCAPVAEWAGKVCALLKPNGRGFVVLMGHRPLPEAARTGFDGPERSAITCAKVGGSRVTAHYEQPSVIRRTLSKHATVKRIEALGCLVPGPPYEGFARRHPFWFGLSAMAETLVRTLPFFRSRGDHTLFEFALQ